MSDISMCISGCSKKLLCKRWTAPYHSHQQAVYPYAPDSETGICAGYYPNEVAEAGTGHYIYHHED